MVEGRREMGALFGFFKNLPLQLFLVSLLGCTAKAEITKSLTEWMCDYCALGESLCQPNIHCFPTTERTYVTGTHTRRHTQTYIQPPLHTNVVVHAHTRMTFPYLGPSDVPGECGTPIWCMFYGLLFLILLMVVYSTIKGETE